MEQKVTAKTRAAAAGADAPAAVLIVEDSPVQSELLRRALDGAGYRVVAARNGADALTMARQNPPDAVVSDINMPVMDGYTMCHAIRCDAVLKHTPVILLTMLSDTQDVIRGLNAGADAYLTKPYNIPSLVSRLESLLTYPPPPPPATERRKVEVRLGGEVQLVDAHSPRMLNLLISTYENAVLQNRELAATQHALEELNQHLEQKVLEKTAAVQASERHYRKLIEGAADVFFIVDQTAKLIYRSPSGKTLTGWNDDEVFGQDLTAFVTPESLAAARNALAQTLRHPEQTVRVELTLMHKDGTAVEVEVLARNLLDDPDVAGIVVTAHDITERKHSEQALKLFRTLIDHAGDAIEVVDPETLRYLDFNDMACQSLGYTREELLSMSVYDIDPTMQGAAVKAVDEQLRRLKSATFETVHRRKDGSTFPAEVSIQRVELDRAYHLVNARDITERVLANKALREAEARYRGIFSEARDGMVLVDAATGLVVDCNAEFERQCGISLAQLKGLHIWELRPPELQEAARATFDEISVNGGGASSELPLQRPDGVLVPVEFRSTRMRLDDRDYLQSTSRDVSERKRVEEQLRRLNWALRALGQSNSALVHAGTENELFQACCEAIGGPGGYALAWIGLARDDAAHSVDIVASAGTAGKYLEDFTVSWSDDPRGCGPTGTAIRTGTTQVTDNLTQSSAYLPWIDKARAAGLASSISLPLRTDGTILGVLTVYSGMPDAFGKSEMELFEELAADISYGVASRRTRVAYEASLVEREEAARKLRAAFESLIAVLASTVERRDPYTAGHQRRVAELAAAIARALGLDQDRIEGLHFAATIHDIGKIYVPAEILARPGKLSTTELALVKMHAQVGFEIVKDVEFPWDVAQAIHQHHERLDGSGYPQGLKGDQIRLEARILAVADVVEAMSSHRPYRAGLGLDTALAQIRQDAGTQLDAQVVDACERVFREQGFAFSKV